MRKRMRNGADPRSGCGTDMGIKCGTDMGIKCVIMTFSPHFYVSVFLIYVLFCNGCHVVLTNYTAISIKEYSLRQ
jgi:hypothetical protein